MKNEKILEKRQAIFQLYLLKLNRPPTRSPLGDTEELEFLLVAALGIEVRQVLTTEPHPQPSSEHLKGKDENRTREAEGKLTAYWWVQAHFECNQISHQTGQEKRKRQAVYFSALFLPTHTCTHLYVWCFDTAHNLWGDARQELWAVTHTHPSERAH